MPPGVAHIEVSVAADVVIVLAENGAGDIVQARVVDQAAEVLVPVYEVYKGRTPLVVMGLAVVAAAVLRPELFKGVYDSVDVSGKQALELKKPEILKEPELLFGEFYVGTLFLISKVTGLRR